MYIYIYTHTYNNVYRDMTSTYAESFRLVGKDPHQLVPAGDCGPCSGGFKVGEITKIYYTYIYICTHIYIYIDNIT